MLFVSKVIAKLIVIGTLSVLATVITKKPLTQDEIGDIIILQHLTSPSSK